MQRIISWNVASVRSRLPVLEKFLLQFQPDICFLQEIKATEENFPFMDFKRMGYEAVMSGQKAYNGVALLSKIPLMDVVRELPGAPQSNPIQARFIQARLPNRMVIICVYVPNGAPPMNNPSDTSRLEFKIEWLNALTEYVQQLLKKGEKIILGGDFNVIEKDTDVYNAKSFEGSSLIVPSVRAAFEKLNQTGLKNPIRLFNPEPYTYSFWDFQMGAWPRNLGILLDFFFVSPEIFNLIQSAQIYRDIRGWEKTSDHAPIGMDLLDK